MLVLKALAPEPDEEDHTASDQAHEDDEESDDLMEVPDARDDAPAAAIAPDRSRTRSASTIPAIITITTTTSGAGASISASPAIMPGHPGLAILFSPAI